MHRAREGLFYIGGHGCVLCQLIETVMFACYTFIFALRNIVLGIHVETYRTFTE